MAPDDHANRRKQPRYKRRLPVRFGDQSRMCGGTVTDISEGGLRLVSPESFPLNTVVSALVQFPRYAIRLQARVVWVGRNPPSTGLVFTQPNPTLIKAYARWLAEVRAAASGSEREAGGGDVTAGPAEADPAQPSTAPPADVARSLSTAPTAPVDPSLPVKRRVETRRGQAYDVLIERIAGHWYLTIYQVPRQLGVREPDVEEAFPDYAAAERALADFVMSH